MCIRDSFIAVLRRDDAVGSHEDRSVEAFKFFFLFPPCVSIVSDKVWIFFEGWVVVGREHLREMCIRDRIIVAAGNPPEYNKSVREFDIVTMDRIRRIDVEPDLPVWKEYAKTRCV